MSNYQNNSFLETITPVTRSLLIINLIVWVGCLLMQSSLITSHFGLHYFMAEKFYLYQLVTYMFTHVDFSHLFFNMFALFMFGSVLERTWGPKRYLTYYFITGIGAGLIQLLVVHFQVQSFMSSIELSSAEVVFLYNSLPVTIGASGAVFGLLLAFGMLYPNAPLYLMFIPVPIKAKYFVIGYGLIEFFFGVSNRAGDNVAHFAHLGGMLFGIIMILYWKKKDKNNNEYRYF